MKRHLHFHSALLVLVSIWTQQVLAGDLFTSADIVKSVSFSQLDISNSIPIVFGNGDTKIAVFADPLDRHTRRLEEEIEKLGNATIYIFISPILGDKSAQLGLAIWCNRERKRTWANRFSIEAELDSHCESPDAITKNLAFAKRFPSQASPILVFENDLVHVGFATRELIRETSLIKPANSNASSSDNLMSQGMWKDSNGVIWMRCSVGQTWDGSTCTGTARQMSWWDAVIEARSTKFGGHNDWRLPHISELWSLARCSNGFDTGNPYRPDPFLTRQGQMTAIAPCNGSRWNQNNFQRPTITQETFPNTASSNYWTSTAVGGRSGLRWRVDFGRAWPDGLYGHAYKDQSSPTTSAARLARLDAADDGSSWTAALQDEWQSAIKSAEPIATALREEREAKARQAARQREEAERQRLASEAAEREAETRFQKTKANKSPQAIYLAAGSYERNGETYRSTQLYEHIISHFPDSVWAVKANDQLLQGRRVDSVNSAARSATAEANERAYKACRIEMDSCYSRNGSNCYRDCNSLR